MATIKAVSSGASIGRAIDYVSNDEKTDNKLLSGIGVSPETAREEMQATKLAWNKTGGRTYKHFVQSFAPDEELDPELAHEIALKLATEIPAFKGHEILVATHTDKDHIHTHFIVNSVNAETGYKLQWSKRDLEEMKRLSDELCQEKGLSLTVKGKTFAGEDREETSSFSKETYRQLQKAEAGEVESYVWNCANAVLDCKEVATSKQDFIDRMNKAGYEVEWSDNRKHITFTDKERKEAGETKCKVRASRLENYFNLQLGKEDFLNGFEVNKERERQLAGDTNTLIRQARADITGSRVAEQNSRADRENREAERQRLNLERQREAERRKQELEKRNQRSRSRSRADDFEI